MLRAGLAALTLSACTMQEPVKPVAPPPARPDYVLPQRSEASRAMTSYYARVQGDLESRGLLRTDRGASDVPFSQRQLVENFVQIALHDEYDTSNGQMIARKTPSRLRRWEGPVRVSVSYGDTVSAQQRRGDQAAVNSYLRRLNRATGISVGSASPSAANFHVFMVNEDERRNLGPELQRLVPGITPYLVRSITSMPRSTFCTVFAFSVDSQSRYYRAVAVIRAEQPETLRLACIHEELAQGMGLANDSPEARPSIFNDDEEFALLTSHDELLLEMLYDPRLRTGMKADEARPILRQIAAELLSGRS